MQDQASNYSRPSAASIFGEDGKLSSASAATSLKYAKPQDLPSYPSSGGVHMSSAGAAASLASSNRKPFEHWKPDRIPAANKAAIAAKDYTMQPLWQPEASKAGSKAALTAHANPTEVEPMQPKRAATTKHNQATPAYDTPANSHSKALMAANAVHNRRRSDSLPTQPAPTSKDDASWALKAATKSHRDGRSAVSGPFTTGDPGFEAARIQNVAKDNVSRQLYTSAPPVSIEVQEKNRQDMLKASAVAMARKMYAIQQEHLDQAAGKSNSTRASNRVRSSTVGGSSNSISDDVNTAGAGYENLEEAARRLAQERLAKIHDEHAEYRNYYGAQSSPPRTRLSMRLRRRASSAADADDSDEEQSRRIRSQMSLFQSKLAEVDSKKRQQDRDALLVIAHRNVDAQISKLDERVFQETGKASPAQMEKWERAAREKAQRDSDERMQNTGKVHIGAGKYLDQAELDAIAKARLQPTLDDIADKAEKQRARDEEERLDKLRKEQQNQTEKTRAAAIAAEIKAATGLQKSEDKARRDAEKREQKEAQVADRQRRRDLVAADKERDRLEKLEKKKSKEEKPSRFSTLLSRGSGTAAAGTAAVGAGATAATAEAVDSSDREESSESSESEERPTEARESAQEAAQGATFHDQVTSPEVKAETPASTDREVTSPVENSAEPVSLERKSSDGRTSLENRSSVDEEKEDVTSPASPTSPTSPTKNKSRVKSWMRVRFRSKSGSQKDNEIMPALAENDGDEGAKAAKDNADAKADPPSKDESRPDSIRDVAMAGRTSNDESDDLYGPPRDVSPAGSKASREKASRDRSPSISSLSSHYSEETKDGKSARSAKSEEATIEEAKVVDLKQQVSSDANESEPDQRGRSGFKARLLRKITPNKTATKDDKAVTPVTSNTTNDDFEEARDTFEEGKLSPPPPLSTLTGENDTNGGTKTLSPKTSREGSRFKEDL